MVGETDERIRLAAALAVRAVRLGSVCADLATVAATAVEALDEPVHLPWPDPTDWVAAVAASPLVAAGGAAAGGQPCCTSIGTGARSDRCAPTCWSGSTHRRRRSTTRGSTAALDRVFSGGGDFAEQRAAVESAVRGTTTVLTGGPGTGKTTTIARLLAVVSEQHELRTGRPPRIAMCAPTAKAAATTAGGRR